MRFDARRRTPDAVADAAPAAAPRPDPGRSDERVRRDAVPPAGVVSSTRPAGAGAALPRTRRRGTRRAHRAGDARRPSQRRGQLPGRSRRGRRIAAVATRRCARRRRRSALDAAASGVRVLGLLDRVWIPVSDFDVTPVVAVADRGARAPPVRGRGRADRRPAARRSCPVPAWKWWRADRIGRSATARTRSTAWPCGATARILSQLGALVAE